MQRKDRLHINIAGRLRCFEATVTQPVEDVFRPRWPFERRHELAATQFCLWKVQAVFFAEKGFHASCHPFVPGFNEANRVDGAMTIVPSYLHLTRALA